MYEPLLFIHSWLRWVVLLGGVYFFGIAISGLRAKRAWSDRENYLVWAFDQILGYQIVFGLTLWIAMSPFVKAAIQDPQQIFQNSVINFWTIRHPLTMISALLVFQIGKKFAKVKPPEAKFRYYVFTLGAVLLLILSAIPWPWASYGRGLFRWIA